MGLRIGWGLVVFVLWDRSRNQRALTIVILVITLGACVLLASDLSRSVAIATPLALAGCLTLARRYPAFAPRIACAVGLINLLIPAAHVTATHIDLINPLPVELYRLLR